MKYTKEILQNAVLNVSSTNELLEYLNIRLSHSMRSYILKLIKQYDIDISHFQNTVKKHSFIKKEWDHYLIKRKSGLRQNAVILRRSLIEYGRPYCCAKCGLGDNWNGSKIVLEVNHINHDFLNDTPENIEFLCPNCHSQKTFEYSQSRRKKKLCECGEEIYKTSCFCKQCASIHKDRSILLPIQVKKEKRNRSRINWPDDDTLSKLVWSMPTKYIAKELNISDIAVIRRCRKLGISKPTKGYWSKVKYGSEENRLSQPVC